MTAVLNKRHRHTQRKHQIHFATEFRMHKQSIRSVHQTPEYAHTHKHTIFVGEFDFVILSRIAYRRRHGTGDVNVNFMYFRVRKKS